MHLRLEIITKYGGKIHSRSYDMIVEHRIRRTKTKKTETMNVEGRLYLACFYNFSILAVWSAAGGGPGSRGPCERT